MPRYTPEQLRKRNNSVWTKVQLYLAPIQFVVFIIGVILTVMYYHGALEDFSIVTWALLIKTLFLVVLFVTGAFFEKEIFDIWVFSPEFLWEDIGSSIATTVHFLYFILAYMGKSEDVLVWTAFAAYFSYVVNAIQYLVRIFLEKQNEKRLKAKGIQVV
ncbi:2-vinyl bacteriochlorophyllide hydratase [Chloroherpeton thalassium ATCC 35110]|uniref:2-vinyl bacteriochlorophyllide hydratase n=1 Tax=Chloroherpeton thalassium (strain ATCC 35110 / GB-78) TaxID=517418 RepID=B3QYU4_CHLT3|nr:2-vinyl bacteriochlorophyllide hydratase [Chloroherpeton thalassium]ACF15167.1 2-vinyl bacteriochlorophyllide hydratase [Chloroherpeton thalassium ATCC 35110]